MRLKVKPRFYVLSMMIKINLRSLSIVMNQIIDLSVAVHVIKHFEGTLRKNPLLKNVIIIIP